MQSISPATAASVTTTSVARPASGDLRRAVVRPGILASVAAAAASTAAAAITSSAGVRFTDHTGSAIPTLAFTTLTLLFSLIGVALAAILAQRAKYPRSIFMHITVTLVALSFVPDLASGFNATATVTLILIHLLAAAIVVPTLSVRLAKAR
jgi:peptidoglycan/LPS O-acetylase OafA/YrhL